MRRTAGRLVAVLGAVVAAAALVGAPAAPAAATATMPTAIVNPVYNADFPDPFLLATDSGYLAFSTQGRAGNVQVAHSVDLETWSLVGDALPRLPVWAAPGNTWAPAVLRRPGGYVLYVTVHDTASGRQCIARATSVRVEGPYVDTSSAPLVCQVSRGGSIDPSPFVDTDGTAYLLWKSEGTLKGEPTRLWSQPLSADRLSLVGLPRQLLSRDLGWEFPIIEAPSMVEHNGRYYLLYSGNEWASDRYAISYGRCASPLGPCTKSTASPVLASSGQVAGPGGAEVFSLPDGSPAIAYHAWTRPRVGYRAAGARTLRIERIVFRGDGGLHFTRLPTHAGNRYRLASARGDTYGFGDAARPTTAVHPVAPVVGLAATGSGLGHWLVASDGGVFAFGDAGFFGSTGGLGLNAPIVGMAASPSGDGYWMVASDGGVFAFGDAGFFGSTGDVPLRAPIVGMAASPSGDGYWMVASDGGVFAFGDAGFFGSTGGLGLNAPIVGMAASPSSHGYRMVASDGGVFAFGDAPFHGSAGALPLQSPVRGIAAAPLSGGYWLVAADGGVFAYGPANFHGSAAGHATDVVGIAP